MAAYGSWSMETLVPNIIESMKRSESKLLAGYIFECFIALAHSLRTESISSVAMSVSKCGGGKLLGTWLCLAPGQDPMQKFG